MRITASTEEQFFTNSEQWEPAMRQLDALIRREMPELKPQLHSGMSITMMGYGVFPYKSKTTEGEWPVIAIAPQKNYASLYVCAIDDGQYLAEKFKDDLGKVNCGRSCIRFKKYEDLNLDGVRKVFARIKEMQKEGKTVFGL